MSKPKRPANIDDLIERMKKGDAVAREALLTWAHAYLRWKAGFLNESPSTGKSDVGQDAIERVLGGLASFRENTGDKFEAWINKIFAMRVVECHRYATRDKRNVRLEIPMAELDPDTTGTSQKSPSQKASDNEAIVDLWAAIFRLPKFQQRAVVLTQLEAFSIAEAAEEMGKGQTAVAGLLQRGIEAVRAQLSPQNDALGNPMSRAARKKLTAAIWQYSHLCDASQTNIDVNTFVETHYPGDEQLRSMLAWIERIRRSRGGGGEPV